MSTTDLIHLKENQVKALLNWPLVYEAVEESLRSIPSTRVNESQPIAEQPTRIFTKMPNNAGTLLAMPGFIGNYKLTKSGRGTENNPKVQNSLGCKLITLFPGNGQLSPPKPIIIGNIFLFSEFTGELKSIVEASDITAWRTAAASLVSTDYLYFKRPNQPTESKVAAIIGCGTQGRAHAIGMCVIHRLVEINLWNRTRKRAEDLANELNSIRSQFRNSNIRVNVIDTPADCVKNADIIATTTFASTPILERSMIKDNVHINAVGAGINHHSELDLNIYKDSKTKIYVDNWGSALTELKTLDAPIEGEVGDIINGATAVSATGITIFHSMGMAVEDVAVAQAVYEKYINNS